MKKFIIGTTITIIILGIIGFFGYKQIMSLASDKLVEQVSNSISDEEIAALKEDPDIKKILEDYSGESLENSNLPIKSKQEAIEVVKEKFSIGEIKDLAAKASGGLTAEEKSEIANELEARLSPEELEALKIIAIQELNK